MGPHTCLHMTHICGLRLDADHETTSQRHKWAGNKQGNIRQQQDHEDNSAEQGYGSGRREGFPEELTLELRPE